MNYRRYGQRQRTGPHSKGASANVRDVSQTYFLITAEEEVVYGNSGYLGTSKRKDAVVRNKSGHKIRYKINRRSSRIRKLSKSDQLCYQKRTCKIFYLGKSRACICSYKDTIKITEDTISRIGGKN